MLAQAKWRDRPEKCFALLKGPLAVRPVYVHKEGRILGLVFCTMLALLLFALLELLARRAGLALSGQQLFAACTPIMLVVLRWHDGTSLYQVTDIPPPIAALLHGLGWPLPERYLPNA
jgi:hypothetical protein